MHPFFSFDSISGIPRHHVVGDNELVPDGKGGYLVRGGWAVGKFGGNSAPPHFSIFWQDGPVLRDGKAAPNGAFVEDVIQVCQERLKAYQVSPFACKENSEAINHLQKAYDVLFDRRNDRKARGVLGKDEV